MDYTNEHLARLESDQAVFIAFFPLTVAGMWLQLWDGPGKGTLVFCPYRKILVLPGNTMHGGGFMSDKSGNLRGHLYIFLNTHPLTKDGLRTNYCHTWSYKPAKTLDHFYTFSDDGSFSWNFADDTLSSYHKTCT
jgi:hypothetical protein